MMFLMDFGVKSAVALSVAFLVGLGLRRASASVRYAMWTCALAGVLVLPLASWFVPRWNIDRSAWRGATTVPDTVPQTATVSIVVQGKRSSPPLPWPAIVWIAGVIAMLVRVGVGHWRVRSLFGKAQKIHDPRWLELMEQAAGSIGLQRALTLKRSAATDVPLSYGLVRATVLLPGESEYWNDERRRIVLAHEMIHARRLDSLWGLLANCALAVNWFNPLAWLAVRQFRKEQERSCDDAVVAAGTECTVYAAHLVDLARSFAIPEPALGMAERFDLEGRVHALLDSSRRRTRASWKVCAAIFTAAMVAIVPLAAVRAQSNPKPQAEDAVPFKSADISKDDSKREIALSKPVRRSPAHEHTAASEEPQATALASISGSVYDPSGAIVPDASVSLKNMRGKNEELARANAGGKYQLQSIPEGEYLIKVTAPGFATYQKTVSLEAGKPATMDVHLAIGEVKEAVEIAAKRGQASASATSTGQRVRVGGMVQPASLISKVNPAYPADARGEGVEGTVLLRAIISKDGSLLHVIQVSSGVDPRLVSAAMAAVPLWRYQPALLNGEPVEVITTIDVTFRLSD